MSYNTRLLTPPREEEDIPLYRPVWRTVIIELGLYGGVMVTLFVLTSFLGVRIPDVFETPVKLSLVLFPVVAWGILSYRQERAAPEPRTRLISALVISALATNALVLPVVYDFLQVERWLYGGGTFDRVLGYTFTMGITQIGLIYLIMRYLIYKAHLRTREDGVAYGCAIALGYVLVSGLRGILLDGATPDVLVARLFSEYAVLVVAGCILGFAVTEMRFNRASWIALPFSASLSALLIGVMVATRTNLLSGGFTILGVTAPRPLFGMVFSIAFTAGLMAAVIFFYNNAERKDEERRREAA